MSGRCYWLWCRVLHIKHAVHLFSFVRCRNHTLTREKVMDGLRVEFATHTLHTHMRYNPGNVVHSTKYDIESECMHSVSRKLFYFFRRFWFLPFRKPHWFVWESIAIGRKNRDGWERERVRGDHIMNMFRNYYFHLNYDNSIKLQHENRVWIINFTFHSKSCPLKLQFDSCRKKSYCECNSSMFSSIVNSVYITFMSTQLARKSHQLSTPFGRCFFLVC